MRVLLLISYNFCGSATLAMRYPMEVYMLLLLVLLSFIKNITMAFLLYTISNIQLICCILFDMDSSLNSFSLSLFKWILSLKLWLNFSIFIWWKLVHVTHFQIINTEKMTLLFSISLKLDIESVGSTHRLHFYHFSLMLKCFHVFSWHFDMFEIQLNSMVRLLLIWEAFCAKDLLLPITNKHSSMDTWLRWILIAEKTTESTNVWNGGWQIRIVMIYFSNFN